MKRVLESTYSPTERRVLFSIRPSTGRNLSRYLEWLENGRHRMERHRELSGAKFMDSANYLDRSATIPLFAPPSLSLSPRSTSPFVSFKVGRRIPRADRGNPSGVPWLN